MDTGIPQAYYFRSRAKIRDRFRKRKMAESLVSALVEEIPAPPVWKYTIARKYMGDCPGSWAIFNKATGRPVVTGLMKSEVNYYRKRIEAELTPKP